MINLFKRLLGSLKNKDKIIIDNVSKIDKLLNSDIDPYDQNVKTIFIDVISPDIYFSLNIITEVNRLNLENNRVTLPTVTIDTVKQMTFQKWYSKSGYIINSSFIKIWLESCREFVIKYESNYKSGDGYTGGNCLKIRPYYVEVTSIVDSLYKVGKIP